MKITGKIHLIKNTQVITEKFSKREFVVETTDSQYPQKILIQMVNDKCFLLDNYKVGDSVDVSININGRAWTNQQGETKYFNTLEGWRIESTGNALNPNDQFEKEAQVAQDDDQDLPF